MASAFCPSCNKETEYIIIGCGALAVIDNVTFPYIEKCAVCKECGSDLHIDSVATDNAAEKLRIYNQLLLAKEKPGL